MEAGLCSGQWVLSRKQFSILCSNTKKWTISLAPSTWLARIWCIARYPSCAKSTGQNTLDSFRRLTFCPTNSSTWKKTWSATRKSSGLSNQQRAHRAAEFSWRAIFRKYLTRTSSLWWVSTLEAHFCSMALSSTLEYMSLSRVWTHCAFTFTKKVWLDLRRASIRKLELRVRIKQLSLCTSRTSVLTRRTSTLWRQMQTMRMEKDQSGLCLHSELHCVRRISTTVWSGAKLKTSA